MEMKTIEVTEMQKDTILAGLDMLEMMLCDNNPHPENELGIANTRALCNEVREKLGRIEND